MIRRTLIEFRENSVRRFQIRVQIGNNSDTHKQSCAISRFRRQTLRNAPRKIATLLSEQDQQRNAAASFHWFNKFGFRRYAAPDSAVDVLRLLTFCNNLPQLEHFLLRMTVRRIQLEDRFDHFQRLWIVPLFNVLYTNVKECRKFLLA